MPATPAAGGPGDGMVDPEDPAPEDTPRAALSAPPKNASPARGFLSGGGNGTPREIQKIGRNDPCYCGSGKKYKKCHGADAPV
jgi:preprotein translocase subunit SecA